MWMYLLEHAVGTAHNVAVPTGTCSTRPYRTIKHTTAIAVN